MRPPVLQQLRHGKLLVGKTFRWFVESWNWLIGYVDNLKGDADIRADGKIQVDRTNPDHPVIRWVGGEVESSPSPSGGDGMCGNFKLDVETNTIAAGYVCVGRTYRYCSGITVTQPGYVVVEVDFDSETVKMTQGNGAFNQPTLTKSYIPLYRFVTTSDGVAMADDYRGAPTVQRWE